MDPIKTHGGARPGAGRPKREVEKIIVHALPITAGTTAQKEAEVFLLAVMNNADADVRLRVDAAKVLFSKAQPIVGIKDQRQEAAKKASTGKFGAAAPPKLVFSRNHV